MTHTQEHATRMMHTQERATRIQSPTDLLQLTGQPLGVSPWHHITQERVNLFADSTGDHQWIHVDPVRAAAGWSGRRRPGPGGARCTLVPEQDLDVRVAGDPGAQRPAPARAG
jgi:acyl dehydratase